MRLRLLSPFLRGVRLGGSIVDSVIVDGLDREYLREGQRGAE
jgi:hypothetical protein